MQSKLSPLKQGPMRWSQSQWSQVVLKNIPIAYMYQYLMIDDNKSSVIYNSFLWISGP